MSDENSFRSGRGQRGQLRRSLPILWGGTFTTMECIWPDDSEVANLRDLLFLQEQEQEHQIHDITESFAEF